VLLQKAPLPIYGKLSLSFWGYYVQNVAHYMIFFLFGGVTVVFVALSNVYSRVRIRQEVGQEIESLKEGVAHWQMESHKANDALVTNQKRAETHQTTCQSHTQFRSSFYQHQRERLNHVLRSIDVVMRSLQNPNGSLPGQELVDILKSCLNVVESIVGGSLTVSRHVPVRLLKTLSNVRVLFTEKMYTSELTMEMHCSEDLTYCGDPVMVEFLLLNLVGKSLYLAPKKGKVDIKVTEQKEGLHIHVRNKGFSMNEQMQKQIMQAFDFFMTEEHFHQLCQENGFHYECTKDKEGLNITTLFFPNVEVEPLGNNVVPLFSNR
jgi:signal transduction histidine kinase